VVYADPGKLLRFHGGLGPLHALAVSGAMTITFAAAGKGTRLTWEYRVSGPAALGLADPVDQVLSSQHDRLKNLVEHGDPEFRKD
jgi:hypothetical protein